MFAEKNESMICRISVSGTLSAPGTSWKVSCVL